MKLLPALLFVSCAWSQAPAPDALVSPEIHAERKVTFRIRAPKANEVGFFADWMKAGTTQKMTRDEAGVWSVTVGPLAPSMYIYNFVVDGVAVADPVNPRIKLRARTSASLVEVPGDIGEARDVPHGSVEINWQKS